MFTKDGKLKSEVAKQKVLQQKLKICEEHNSMRQLQEARELDFVTKQLQEVEGDEEQAVLRLKHTQKKTQATLAKLDKII